MEVADKNEQEIAESYLSSLVDLTTNSKPLINMLTMLAEENIEHGQTIVDAVQRRITEVDPDYKLPILYLIDSIVKNVGGVYITLFSHSIVNIFIAVFETVNEHVRQKMFQLRQTWNDVFPIQKLSALDVQVSAIDPNWPIVSPPKIHLNPNFHPTVTEKNLQTELQKKQRELLELKKKKLELELAATQKQLTTVGLVPSTTTVTSQPVAVDPTQIINQNIMKNVYKAPSVPVQVIPAPLAVVQPVTNNNRQRIAPVNSALINSMRLRDPRLMRQPPQSGQIMQPPQHLAGQKLESNGPLGPIPRISNSNFANNNNAHRRANIESVTNETTTKFSNNTSTDSDNKHSKSSSRSTTSSRSSSKSNKSGSSSNSNNNKSSSISSSSKSSNSKNERNSRSSSSSSSMKKSKNRKDDKSPQRKKSSSRHRSPTRRSSSPADTTKSPRKSSYSSKSKTSSSSSSSHSTSTSVKHHKDKSNSNNNSNSNNKTVTSIKIRDYSRNSHDERSKSPNKLIQTIVDLSTKDVDLRAQLHPSINLNTNSIIKTSMNENDTTTSTVITSLASNICVADRKMIKNSDTCGKSFLGDALKDVDLRVAIPGISSNQTTKTTEPKKRISIDEHETDEPKLKKSKSEKIDILFGTEDVDLRIAPLNAITSSSLPVDDEQINISHEPIKGRNSKVKNRNRDIDLRQRIDLIDDNSQESNDKIKLILMQAQEQVENSDVNPDQIQSMVQQMMKIKSDSDARKSFKRNNSTIKTKDSTLSSSTIKKLAASSDQSEIIAFSSDSDDETLKKSHRVPNKRRRVENEKLSPNKSNNNNNNNNNSSGSTATTKSTDVPVKERRPRKTKWNSPWEDKPPITSIQQIPNVPFTPAIRTAQVIPAPVPTVNIGGGAAAVAADNLRQFSSSSSRNVPESIWQQNVIPFTPPVPQIAMLNNVMPNLIGNQQIIMAQSSLNIGPGPVKERTINIDGVPREIRFYGETAIAFMEPGGREPKEIGFQSGERRLCVDNNETIVLAFNDTYKPIIIKNKQYQIRFGSPTRELYIDNEWYECYFGDPPVHILLDNELHIFRIDGPAPQVRIGNLRTDLIVGKVDMYVGTTTKVSLFLDAQTQIFELNNQQHTIQFADSFLTVLIDNTEFPNVKYGGMPDKFHFGNTIHYIRFSVLPKDVLPGKTYVRHMVRTKNYPDLDLSAAALNTNLIGTTLTTIPVTIPPVTGPILPLMSIVPNPDIIASTSSSTTSGQTLLPSVTNQINNQPVITESINPALPMDINDLYQKLLATGIINKSKASKEITSPNKEREKPQPVSLNKPETLKKRQAAIVNTLFSGMQCSSCGVRFPLEQTIKYSQHLDWHYRQNRRERDSARRAHSRKWYYDVSDWIQYEEIENLDEREKNWFETQQNDVDTMNEDTTQRSVSPPPSCVAGPDDHNKTCDMCHDLFETFYNEETEEWHLRNAVRIDEHTYHPVCYEDYKISLTLDESNLNVTNVADLPIDDNAVDMEIKDQTNLVGNDGRIPVLDDDDDVIVLPQDDPIITEIPDDDEHELGNAASNELNARNVAEPNDVPSSINDETGQKMDSASKAQNSGEPESTDDECGKNNESDVQILEPQISIMNLDEYDETKSTSATLDESQIPIVKIKQEPKYEGYEDNEDDDFEDVGTFEADPVDLLDEGSVDEYVPQPTVSSQPTLIASIDGNVELQDAPAPAIGTNKIKINITKNVQLNKNSINSSESVDDNLAINNRELKSTDALTQSNTVENSKNYVANDTDRCGRGGGVGENGLATSDSINVTTGDVTATNRDSTSLDAIDIEFEVKDSIKHIEFKRQPVVQSGLETSGLCSIM